MKSWGQDKYDGIIINIDRCHILVLIGHCQTFLFFYLLCSGGQPQDIYAIISRRAGENLPPAPLQYFGKCRILTK